MDRKDQEGQEVPVADLVIGPDVVEVLPVDAEQAPGHGGGPHWQRSVPLSPDQ